MKCLGSECNNEITVRSKSGLCKIHYSYLWKSNNKDRTSIHSKTTYEQKRDMYIANSAKARTEARKNNPLVKLRDSLRRRLNNAVKNNQKSGSAVSDLGCTIIQLKIHLESKFTPEMTWDNYGIKGWHIDHIVPISKFDLTDLDQLKKACHYTNLQPLWWQDNLSKGSK